MPFPFEPAPREHGYDRDGGDHHDDAHRREQDLFDVRPFTPRCGDLLVRGEHALIGVSPGNSYFTQGRLTQLLRWAGRRFAGVDVLYTDLHLDSMHRACGADEQLAAKRTNRALRDVRRRIRRALEDLGSVPARFRTLALSETVDLPGYHAALRRVDEQLASNPWVQQACEEHVAHVLGDRVGPEDPRYHAALDYLRAELPYLLSTPEVLRVGSSVSCYHALLPVVEELHDEGSCFHPAQGHVVIRPRHPEPATPEPAD